MADCWKYACLEPGPNCHFQSQWTIDNVRDNPVLYIPDFVPKTIMGGCETRCMGSTEPRAWWAHFCTPPVAPSPISAVPYSIDISRPPVSTGDYNLNKGFAIAIRFSPLSVCLPYIVFHHAYNLALGKKTVVEIRKNNPATNLPMGTPGDNNLSYLYGIVTVEFATDLHTYAVPVNSILDTVDEIVWIVLYSEDYACSDAFVEGRLKLRKSDIGANNVAVFSQANGCTWAMDNTVKSVAFTSYKSAACNGTVVVSDFAFAKLGNPPIYLNDNCFVRLQDVIDSKVAIGVKYTNPDPVRMWKRVRFSFAYKKPDLRYFSCIQDVFDVAPGQYETFFEMDDPYFAGIYDELLVSAAVIQV